VSLSKKDGPMEVITEVIVQSEVESEAKSTKGDEAKLQEGHNQEAKEVIKDLVCCFLSVDGLFTRKENAHFVEPVNYNK
jgi:hypothetical protein